jgi:hypothetical protein
VAVLWWLLFIWGENPCANMGRASAIGHLTAWLPPRRGDIPGRVCYSRSRESYAGVSQFFMKHNVANNRQAGVVFELCNNER